MGTKYTEEFKRDALRIYEQEGARATSEKLGVSIKTLYAWHRAQRLENGSITTGARPWETIEQQIGAWNGKSRSFARSIGY